MIDDRNSVSVRRTSLNSRYSESLPDYEDVKVFLKNNDLLVVDINLDFFL